MSDNKKVDRSAEDIGKSLISYTDFIVSAVQLKPVKAAKSYVDSLKYSTRAIARETSRLLDE